MVRRGVGGERVSGASSNAAATEERRGCMRVCVCVCVWGGHWPRARCSVSRPNTPQYAAHGLPACTCDTIVLLTLNSSARRLSGRSEASEPSLHVWTLGKYGTMLPSSSCSCRSPHYRPAMHAHSPGARRLGCVYSPLPTHINKTVHTRINAIKNMIGTADLVRVLTRPAPPPRPTAPGRRAHLCEELDRGVEARKRRARQRRAPHQHVRRREVVQKAGPLMRR